MPAVKTILSRETFRLRLSEFAGPAHAADIDAAAAHEIALGEILRQRATPQNKLQASVGESAGGRVWFTQNRC